jgi:uncharacterized protein (TIGR04255 family)
LKLANPPVIEVGVEFHFDPRSDKQPWDLPVAASFIHQFEHEFPHVEVLQSEQIRIEKRAPGGAPEQISGQISLDRIRARNEEATRWIQVGNDLLVHNLVRKDAAYPGFDQLRDHALAILDGYIDYFKPVAVRQAAVTYLDLIEIPAPDNKAIRLDDYLRLRVEFPDNIFGPVGFFSVQLLFPQATPGERLTLWLHTAPARADQRLCRLQMNWQYLCENLKTLDKGEIFRQLETAHVRLRECFRASFTNAGWALFQPINGDAT